VLVSWRNQFVCQVNKLASGTAIAAPVPPSTAYTIRKATIRPALSIGLSRLRAGLHPK
jgi:hypothetical protein